MKDDPGAACEGGLVVFGQPLQVFDSVTQALGGHAAGAAAVTGSHGGTSAGRFALEAGLRLVVFNDAGRGLDDAGIAALALLQPHGIAACTVAHHSARIGEAASTLATGVISQANAPALALGLRPGLPLHAALARLHSLR